jgi:hypothetical protein
MRIAMFIITTLRLRDNSGDLLLPCRSAPFWKLT